MLCSTKIVSQRVLKNKLLLKELKLRGIIKIKNIFCKNRLVLNENEFSYFHIYILRSKINVKQNKEIMIRRKKYRTNFNECFNDNRDLYKKRTVLQHRCYCSLNREFERIEDRNQREKNYSRKKYISFYEKPTTKLIENIRKYSMGTGVKDIEKINFLENDVNKEKLCEKNVKENEKQIENNAEKKETTNETQEESKKLAGGKYKFGKFSIFSFNILANSLVDEKYDQNNIDVLKWINRKKSIFLNVMKKQSDIICLQEIEEEYFIELKKELEKKNYKELFFKKKKEFCKDGLCIFYNCNVFELLFFDEIVFDKTNILKKWQVGLIVALKNLKTKKIHTEKGNISKNEKSSYSSDDIVIVGNTHLMFDFYKGDVKLYQLCYLTYRIIIMLNKCVNYLKKKCEEHNTMCDRDFLKPCIVLCGDFNLTPNSLLYYFVINRFINLKNVNLELLSGQYLMFKEEFYFNYYKKGKIMKNLFDEHIMSNLRNMQNKKATENVKKEALFLFFRNKNILKEEYIMNMFNQKENYLINYDFFEHTFEKKKSEILQKTYNLTVSGNDKDEKTKMKIEETKNDVNKKIDNWNENAVEQQIKEQGEDFILYYPLYFKSVYNNMCDKSRKEQMCYEYDNIDNIRNDKNNEIEKDIPFTVFHGKQKGCVDYIFYSYKNLDMISCSELPSFESLSKWGCLPNEKYSASDHLYLHATLIRKN